MAVRTTGEWQTAVPVQSVKVGNGDALEEGDDEQRDVAAEIVKQGEDVIAGAVSEDHRQDAAKSAERCCYFNQQLVTCCVVPVKIKNSWCEMESGVFKRKGDNQSKSVDQLTREYFFADAGEYF